jgi:hypothetical protein
MVYDARWGAHSSWYSTSDLDPTVAPVNTILGFLTSLVKAKAINTVKGYVTAISNRHAPIDEQPCSIHHAVSLWIIGLMKQKGLPMVVGPQWNLEIVLHALKKWPFELLRMAANRYLTCKAIFLAAIASARRAGELCALACSPPQVRGHYSSTTYSYLGTSLIFFQMEGKVGVRWDVYITDYRAY